MQNIKVFAERQTSVLDSVSVSCVIYGFHEGKLKVLLSRLKADDNWMLPFGLVDQSEDVDDAAYRVIKAKTGLEDIYIQQFHLFGKCSRYQQQKYTDVLLKLGVKLKDNPWSTKRIVSIGYFALVKYDLVNISTNSTIEEKKWFDLDQIPRLFSDHNEVINRSLRIIKREIGYIPLGYELLPEKFIMPDLRIIYETFIGHELDRRNFQRKMLSVGLIIKLDEKMKKGAHKSPYLYSFIKEKCKEALESGEQLMIWSIQ